MALSRYFLALVYCVFFIVVGCSYTFDIKVTGDDPFHPTFRLRSPIFAPPVGTRKVQLKDLEVLKEEDGTVMWSLAIKQHGLIEISHVVYGKVPEGFREITPAGELKEGTLYFIGGISGGGQGTTMFIIVKKNGAYHIEQRKKIRSPDN